MVSRTDAPCPLCGAAAALRFPPSSGHGSADAATFACTNVHAGDHGPVYWCAACQLGFSPPPDAEQVLSLYEDVSDPTYLIELENRQRHAHAILRTIERWHPPGRLLELGSQVGILLRAAEDRGWEATGIEPSKWAVAQGRELFKVNLIHGSAEAAEYAPGSFDCIVMVDVLEHLVDPLAALQRCRPWLAPDGILVLSTVNMATLTARVLGTNWPGFMDMHLSYFTPTSLRQYLRRANFAWIASRPDTRSFSLGYLCGRLEHNGPALRVASRLGKLPLIRSIRIALRSHDLLLVVARPV